MRSSNATVPGNALRPALSTAAVTAINVVAGQAAPLSESGFQERLRASIGSQFDRFAYYRQICAKRKVSRADLLTFVAEGAYHRLPGVASSAFKLSKGMIEEVNDLSGPGLFQVSSSTSGDPSYVYTGPAELAHIISRYGETFGFAGVPVGIGFAPSLRILRALSKKAAHKGKKAVLRMQLGLEGGNEHYERTYTTVDVDILKTVLNRIIGRPASIRKMPAAEIASIVRDTEKRGHPVSLGGLTLLLRPYLDEFREGEFALHDKGYVAFSGGGYSGAKGSIRGAKIDKSAFVAKIGAVFGIDPELWGTHIKDIYSFTETSAQIVGFWDRGLDDFLFRPAADHRVYIVDPETEAPLRSGRGIIKIVAPYTAGRPTAANTCVLQFDEAEIVTGEDDGRVSSFSHVSRFAGVEAAGTIGCAFKAAEIAGV